jgi:hypothetical protein
MKFGASQLFREKLVEAALQDGIKYRAVRMGVITGEMPEVEFIWEIQRSEGVRACFGQGYGCKEFGCRWRNECMALEQFAD